MIKDQENIITIKLDYKSSDTERILACQEFLYCL